MSITPGAIRFNTDSMKLEYYHGGAVGLGTLATGEWVQLTTDSPDVQTGGTRGVFAGGEGTTDTIEYVNISTTGNVTNFGDLVVARRFATGCSSRTRGLFGTGGSPYQNDIDFITIASTGDAADFGETSETGAIQRCAAVSNQTRGMWAGGFTPGSPATLQNIIQYVTISSTGNTKDFGDLSVARYELGGFASSTRGVFFSGSNLSSTYYNTIDFVTISTQGNAADFGDINLGNVRGSCGGSNAVRGVYGSGYYSPSRTNYIEYVTIASLGNGTNFGDLTIARAEVYGSCASPTRCLWAGGQSPGLVDTIDYVQIMSTGDAVDFGNLSGGRSGVGACSNGHGGLG
jgi:hypothetical protein